MALSKPRTMPGVLELLPREQIAFQHMLDRIRASYERFGFLPIETPVIEFSDVLLSKTGGDTERQVYFVQSTGARERGDESDLALRFDLTVPLARYVAEHERELSFPFRRYQIQRVYRGERAQRGRFREFYQCDIDVIGRDTLSLHHDAEIPAVIHAVFDQLAIGRFSIELNHRKLMRGFFEGLGVADENHQTMVLREVDKLDKRGVEHVRDALCAGDCGLSVAQADKVLAFVSIRSTSLADALSRLAALEPGTETFEQGRRELAEVLGLIAAMGVPESDFALNLSIARGLDYYTGMVYETRLVDHPEIGSICSGGRYENLVGQYTKSSLPGVGISIGATRLFWQLREAGLISCSDSTVDALVTQLNEADMPRYLALASKLRQGGINTEVMFEGGKLGKQFKYADRAGIRFVLVLGEDEIAHGSVTVKDLLRNQQFEVPQDELLQRLRAERQTSKTSETGETGEGA